MTPAPTPRRLAAFAAPAAGIGLALTLGQVVTACLLTGETDPGRAYRRLFHWDSLHYGEIMDNGYHCPPTPTPEARGNVAFFPAYPLSGRLVQTVTGWTTPISLLVAAQLACWGFWTYLLLLLRHRWGVSPRLAALGCLLVASRPPAFFLVAAYSEPLFLMSLLGFVYWSGGKSAAAPFLAALHGFVLTATRIAGLPVVVYPILYALLNAPQGEGAARRVLRLVAPVAVAAAAALGGGLFFLYCQLCFGHWDLYMRTQLLGWNVRPDYFALFSADAYRLGWPPWLGGTFEPSWFSHFYALLLLPVFAGFLIAEVRTARAGAPTGWRARAPIYVAAWLVYYLSLSGTSRLGMTSMSRYALVPEVLLLLCLVHLLSRAPFPGGRLPIRLRVGLAAWALFGFVYQLHFTSQFTRGAWVA